MKSFSKIRALVFDLDGTVYEGDHLVDGVLEAISRLRSRGFVIYYCTNNSTRTRAEIADKLRRMGIETSSSFIFSAGYAAAHCCAGMNATQVSLLGTPGLKAELCSAGLTVNDELDAGRALVVGLDPAIDYPKMCRFAPLLGKDMPVIACNRDRWFPADNGRLKPGCGIIVDLVEALLGRSVDLVAGKPTTLLLELLTRQSGLHKDELLIIGDSFESDVALAEAFGSPWVLYAPGGRGKRSETAIASMAELPGLILK